VINAAVRAVGLDLVQLHGDESPEMLNELDVPAIKAFGLTPGASHSAVRSAMIAFAEARRPPIAFLIDGQFGGTGSKADWSLAAEIAREFSVILAGGLTPDNVAEAIATVGPFAVDVSSGVETDGIKDAAKITSFVARARSAFAAIDRTAPTGAS
jgi:phosphoribosylanthranilate isomerase